MCDSRGSDSEHDGSDISARLLDFQHESSDSDGDACLLQDFDEVEACHRLYHDLNGIKLVLSVDDQKECGLEIGINVTDEHAWKLMTKENLLDTLPDSRPELIEFREKLASLDDGSQVLIGYVSELSGDQTDMFIFFINDDDAREASEIVKRLEANDRQYLKKSLYKYPRPWRALGSEKEVKLQIPRQRDESTEIEIQRVDTGPRKHAPFQHRFVADVRDGYVELVPKKQDFEVLQRRRINLPTQSAPRMVSSEQQTDPTFPANAWTQYLYEVAADDESDDEDEANTNAEIVIPSASIEELLKTLEFNSIDMYRNDYSFIAKNSMTRHTNIYLEEAFCFSDLSKCRGKYACSIDWHPVYSGICAVSYTYNTINTLITNDEFDPDFDKKLAMSTNPVLIWSFDDVLYPKLELESVREITTVSFCPYDENILIGGCITGQIVIWDLKGCLERVEIDEVLTENQAHNRKLILSFMNWTQLDDDKRIVKPVAISPAEYSHRAAITSIKWLNRKYYVAQTGQLLESTKPNETFRHFVSASLDGTISFWDLDYVDSRETKASTSKKKYTLPDYMKDETSPYEKLNNVIRPNYTLAYDRPIANMIFDEGIFRYTPVKRVANRKSSTRVAHSMREVLQENLVNKFIVGSLAGTLTSFMCEGFLCKDGKPEVVKQTETFAAVHDGPILNVERNPFISELFISIGKNIVAIWSEQLNNAPIFWRRRSSPISYCKWSSSRVSVFFLTYYDGSVEVWDLLTRIDEPCVSHALGGSVLTILSQHKLSLPHEMIAVGDQNGNLRILKLPKRIAKSIESDLERMKNFIRRELDRKAAFQQWQRVYREKNRDVRHAKETLKEEAAENLRKLEREAKDRELLKSKKTLEEQRLSTQKTKNKSVYDLPDRLNQKWDAMNIKRLMGVLLAMKRFDPELLKLRTKPERERLAYEEEKKMAILEKIRATNTDVAEIRSRLLPQWDADTDAERLNMIRGNVTTLVDHSELVTSCDAIERESETMMAKMEMQQYNLTWEQIIIRARQRREQLNRSVIADTNFKRSYLKEYIKSDEEGGKSDENNA